MDSCDECDFRYGDVDPVDVGNRLRSYPPLYRELLAALPDELARRRPDATVWSALEYACHVRDLLLVQRDRAVLAQVEDRPSVARMHRDERAELCRYRDEAIAAALDHLSMAAALCAAVFEGLDSDGWTRPLVYNWPAPAERDLAWLGRHTVHEAHHHLRDLAAVVRRVATSG